MIGDGLSGPEATDRLLKEWMPSSEKDPDAAAIVGVIAWLQQVENYSARRTRRWFSGE
jgi:hypothetical protein